MMEHLKFMAIILCCIAAVIGASLGVVGAVGYAAKAYLILTDEGP